MKTQSLLCILFCFGLISGCVKNDDFDFDKVTSSTWSPDLAVPLINSNLTIKDIIGISDSGTFTTDPNHFVTLVYRNTLYSVSAPELIPIPDQQDNQRISLTPTDSTILLTTRVSKTINNLLPLNFPNNAVLSSIVFRNAFLKVNVSSMIPLDGVLNVTIPALSLNGIPFSKDINVTPLSALPVFAIDSFDLSGYTVDLSTLNNQLGIIYTVTFGSPALMPSHITNLDFIISAGINNISPAAVYGNIGNQQLSINEDTSNITFFDNFQNGSIFFQDPKMTFNFSNSFGIPVTLNIGSIVAHNSAGNSHSLSGYPSSFILQAPATPGQVVQDSIVLTTANSSIQAGMAINPNYIVYSLSAIAGSGAMTGFVLDSSNFQATARIDLPLRGYANGFIVQDTANFELENIDKVESAIFRINISNGFPGKSINQIYFTDENYVVLDSMFSSIQNEIVQSASINGSGMVISPTTSMSDEPFSGPRLQHLFSSKKLLIKSVVETTDSPNRIVEIYDYYKIGIKVGVRTKLKARF